MSNQAQEMLRMLDEGVPLPVAALACRVDLQTLSEGARQELTHRQANARAKVMAKLWQTTQRASANPSAIASAAQAWLKMSEDGKTEGQSISINIVGEEE
jgi:hypothetical protein